MQFAELEDIAEQRLATYRGGYLLEKPQAIDIEHFAEFALQASLDFAQLSTDQSILGLTTFATTSLSVRDKKPTIDLTFPPRTIVLDTKAHETQPETRHRFTVAHECAHLILHEQYFLKQHQHGAVAKVARCESNTTSQPADGPRNRLELQANHLGACLLMPRPTFTSYFNAHLAAKWREMNTHERQTTFAELAGVFQVSREAAKWRIRRLGLKAK
ncbi:ImmA/IrrE family metallo-endopeptidase [Gulosibacter bifidus]|uniref:ImmA/IrrE family metallo-endopeptidase n=1 Tax=Gulosibacter bifidus TaxID=272239 RepID=A0ABW5RIL7_9MICO|nr:ImmA/IrrE family metallo-endopeptidase [Gulosibacter bifidus]